MSWFVLALIAPLVWAVVNLIDDHLLRSVYRSATIGAVLSGVIGFLPALYIYIFHQPQVAEPKLILSAVAAGMLTVLFYYFYFRTLQTDDPSVAIALNNLAPAIVPFLAFFLLSERLQPLQYAGIGIIVIASSLIGALDIKKLKFAKSVWYALCGAICYAMVSILAKYAYEGASFGDIYFWIAVGFGVGGIIAFILLKEKNQLRQLISSKDKKLVTLLLGVELLNMAGELIQGAAINGGPVSIVRGLEGIQPLYVLTIGIVLARFLPNHFRERRDERFNKKIICMGFMIVGLFML
ncbi:MAG: DMT family transporter [Patescibacteria group bacterium]